ncbi:MAG: TRAP transporter small permease subunit [Carbonactinosporaceae bacterium]
MVAEHQPGRRGPTLLRWVDRVSEVTGYLSGASIFIATLVICYAVVLRAFGQSTVWQTELTIYLLMFVTFVGGAYGLKHGEHVNVDLLLHRLPRRAGAAVELVAACLALVVIAVVGWRSSEMVLAAAEGDWTSGTAWNPSLVVPYAVLPLGMALMALQYLVIMVRLVRRLAGEQG